MVTLQLLKLNVGLLKVFLDLFSVCMTCRLFNKGDTSWKKYIQITR